MRNVTRWTLAVFCAVTSLQALPAEARRVALVIGNADYKVGPLQNPVNDAAAVAEAFGKQLGFDKVILKRNLGAGAFRAALREMAQEALGAEFAVVYFAGHGVEVAGRNYLIPTDAALAAARDVELEAIALDTVLGQLDGVRKLKLVILDACRNSIFPLAGARRSVSRGLARIEPEGNTLVAYAAKDGTTADDGAGRRHSPFTEALLKHIATPGLEIRQLFGYVRDEVASTTRHQQQPYLYGTLGGPGFYLQPQTLAPAAPAAAPPGPLQLSEAERAWAVVKDSSSVPVLEAYRRQYGASNVLYDRLAAARIEDLTKPQVAPAAPPPALARLLQVELQRVGCNPGAIDGAWGGKGKAALERFARHAKLNIPTDEPTLAALDAVKGQNGRICPLECGPNTVEKDGTCLAKSVPSREPVRSKAAPARKPAARKPAQRRKPDDSKTGMCWAIDPRGRSSTIVPCTDSRATMKAY